VGAGQFIEFILTRKKEWNNCNGHIFIPFVFLQFTSFSFYMVIWLRIFWYFGKVVTDGRWPVTRGSCTGKFNCISV